MAAHLLEGTDFPVMVWGREIEAEAEQQLRNMTALPYLYHHVAAMPDVHWGMGATVGTVMASGEMIVPAAVGVDIGCGVSAARLSLGREWFLEDQRLPRLRQCIEQVVPVGFGQHKPGQVSDAAAEWAGRNLRAKSLRAPLGGDLLEKARLQLGTLGGGNHFIEVCFDEQERCWVMLHSGSRHIGLKIAQHYIQQAKEGLKQAGRLGDLPDANLAYFTKNQPQFRNYLADLYWAQDYARFNRQEIMRVVLELIAGLDGDNRKLSERGQSRKGQGGSGQGRRGQGGKGQSKGGAQRLANIVLERVDCHHNYVRQEEHFGRKVYVTRKGALSAAKGERAVIPGSMGTASYIVEGKGNPESFCSCAHGAGRRMSRKAAKRRFTLEDLLRQTEGVDCRKDKGVLDEIPQAYKDIDEVMAQQADLVEIQHKLRQVLCVKG